MLSWRQLLYLRRTKFLRELQVRPVTLKIYLKACNWKRILIMELWFSALLTNKAIISIYYTVLHWIIIYGTGSSENLVKNKDNIFLHPFVLAKELTVTIRRSLELYHFRDLTGWIDFCQITAFHKNEHIKVKKCKCYNWVKNFLKFKLTDHSYLKGTGSFQKSSI